VRALPRTLPNRLLLLVTLAALLLALVYAQARTGVAHAATTVNISIMNGVTMSSFKFSPSPASAHVGDTVKWTNNGTVTHTVTLDANPAKTSGNLAPGKSFSAVVTRTGTFKYHCSIHPFMHGTLTVS
jgi:plastocyanin